MKSFLLRRTVHSSQVAGLRIFPNPVKTEIVSRPCPGKSKHQKRGATLSRHTAAFIVAAFEVFQLSSTK
jgi:hypothetical protein